MRVAVRLARVFGRAKSRLLLNATANTGAAALNGILGFIIVPVLLGGLGVHLYGVWVTVMSVPVLANSLTSGIRWSVVREVAAHRTVSQASGPFLNAVVSLLLIVGGAGAVLITTAGFWMASWLVASGEEVTLGPPLFAFVAGMFLADALAVYPTAVLQGLQRYVPLNGVITISGIARATGVFALTSWVSGGTLLVAVAAWSCVISVATLGVLVSVVRTLAPHLRFRPRRLAWPELRERAGFGVVSQLNSMAGWILWQSGVWILSVIAGTASAATFAIGQRIPIAAQLLYWRNADVLYPLAARYREKPDLVHASLATVTRTNLVMTLPLCVVCWLFAPQLLQLWIGSSTTDAEWVMRFMALAVLADAAGAGASQVVWGLGFARSYLYSYTGAAVLTAIGMLVASRLQGAAAAAAVLCVGISLLSAAFLALVSKYLDRPARSLFARRKAMRV